MGNRYERCRWSSSDSIGDIYCVCDASDNCTEIISGEFSPCVECHHFFSSDDIENMQNKDEDIKELI